MSDEELNKEKIQGNIEDSAGFVEVDDFIKKGEEGIQEKEEQVADAIEREEEKLEELEEEKEELQEKEEEIKEKIDEEKEKVEELKQDETELKKAEQDAGEIREDMQEKRKSIKDSILKVKEIFKRGKIREKREGQKKPFFKTIYEEHYKKLLIIPFILLLLAIFQIAYQYNVTGDFVNRGVELKGGITLTIPGKSYDTNELEQILNSELGGDVSVRSISKTKGLLIEASDVDEKDLLDKMQKIFGELDPGKDYSLEEMGSSLGASFFREIIKATIIAFILMGLVVFIAFRVPAPSLAVILAAFSDIVITLAIFNLTGAKLGKGGIAAFLMLIGYSVDTDILLSTKVLKRKFGTVMDRIYSAMKTGLTMNITTITALIVALIFTQSEVIRQIMLILLIGLCVDIINTWIQNVGVLRLYLERKGRSR